MLEDVLNLLNSVQTDDENKIVSKKRKNKKINQMIISKNNLHKDIASKLKENFDISIDNETIEKFIHCFEDTIFDYGIKSMNEKISIRFDFLDDEFQINYHPERKVRNPSNGTTFIAKPKTQLKFLSKRKDEDNLINS